MEVKATVCDQSSESDSEGRASQRSIRCRCNLANEQGDKYYLDIDPRNITYRSSTDQNTSSSSRSSSYTEIRSGSGSKPHKAQDAGWEAMRAVKSRDGSVGLSHFRLLQRLGSGDIGSVYLSQLRGSACYFAIKVMDKRALASRNKLLRAQTEKEILEVLDHPFLPTLYAHIETRQFSCLVMEFCPGGDLHVLRQRQPSKRFSDDAVRFYAAEVLLALEYLHMMGIVYRDLKPENVLVREDGHIMLSDFDLSLKCTVKPTLTRFASSTASAPSHPSFCSGSSCILPLRCISPCSIHPGASCLPISIPRLLHLSSRRKSIKHHPHDAHNVESSLPELLAEPTSVRSMSFVGTHEYLAPEIILGDGHGSAVDWWTFGIFLFELLYGKTPFKGTDNELTLMNVVTQPLQFPEAASETCVAVKDLIGGLLHKDPQKRLACVRGAAEVKLHAFFEGVNWALIRCAIPPEIPSPLRLVKVESPKSKAVTPTTGEQMDKQQKQNKGWVTKAETIADFEIF